MGGGGLTKDFNTDIEKNIKIGRSLSKKDHDSNPPPPTLEKIPGHAQAYINAKSNPYLNTDPKYCQRKHYNTNKINYLSNSNN